MNFTVYQALAAVTSNTQLPYDTRLAVAGLGLAGESGEVADHLKKALGHGHTLDINYLRKELGDLLWYVAETCSLLGIQMDDVASGNIDKLAARYPDGFEAARSLNRSES